MAVQTNGIFQAMREVLDRSAVGRTKSMHLPTGSMTRPTRSTIVRVSGSFQTNTPWTCPRREDNAVFSGYMDGSLPLPKILGWNWLCVCMHKL